MGSFLTFTSAKSTWMKMMYVCNCGTAALHIMCRDIRVKGHCVTSRH